MHKQRGKDNSIIMIERDRASDTQLGRGTDKYLIRSILLNLQLLLKGKVLIVFNKQNTHLLSMKQQVGGYTNNVQPVDKIYWKLLLQVNGKVCRN